MGDDKYLNKYLIDPKSEKIKFINKMLIFGTLVFVVIITSTIVGLLMAKAYNEKLFAEYNKNVENVVDIITKEEPQEEVVNNILLPIYSENAKNKIQNIYHAEGEEKVAYLTFDDGPSSNITPQILQILQNEGIKATFFILGSRAELYPDLVKQEYEAGHYIANHGYSHNYKDIYSSKEAVLDEYNKTENAIRQAIGNDNYSSHLFRFPGGSSGGKYANLKKEAISLLDENNIAHINWNALTNDAVGTPTAESIINDLKSTAEGKNSIVVLMHDASTKQLTADTLPTVISYLREQGYSFKNFYDIMCE